MEDLNPTFGEELEDVDTSNVEISVNQRGGRGHITIVAGLADDLDLKRIHTAIKRIFSCTGAVKGDPVEGEVLIFAGDHKIGIRQFLIDEDGGSSLVSGVFITPFPPD